MIAGNRLDTPSPTATVTVILGFADCVADQPVDTGLRVRRADAARRFLLDSGALPANIGPATVDLSADAPGDNSPGLGRDLLRSARVVLDVRKPPDPPSNGRTTHRYHLVMKSFIRTIGWDAGSLLCPLHPANQIGDVIGVSANLRLRALAAVTDLGFGETAPTDTRDNLYRLYSARDFTVICEDGSPVAISGSEIDTDNGHEGPLSTPALTVFDRSQTGGGSSPLRFAWSAKGRPALAAEPAFQGVCWRTSRYIWHHVEGAVDCAGLRVTSVLGSHFPTHRVYLDGTVVSTIPQGPFVNLWHPAADPEMVE